MLTGVAGIHLGDDLPCHIGYRVSARDGARQVDLDGIDEGDMVHDLANGPAVGGDVGVPHSASDNPSRRRPDRQRLARCGRKRFSAANHCRPPCRVAIATDRTTLMQPAGQALLAQPFDGVGPAQRNTRWRVSAAVVVSECTHYRAVAFSVSSATVEPRIA